VKIYGRCTVCDNLMSDKSRGIVNVFEICVLPITHCDHW